MKYVPLHSNACNVHVSQLALFPLNGKVIVKEAKARQVNMKAIRGTLPLFVPPRDTQSW